MDIQKRAPAVKVWIHDILNATHHPDEENTNTLILKDTRNIFRVNILAIVINKTNDAIQTLDLEDGTGHIYARIFENDKITPADVGDCILLIGRPREYQHTKYIAAEIIKKINDPLWITIRKLENPKTHYPSQEQTAETSIQPPINDTQKILDLITAKDTGSGAEYEEIIHESHLPNAETIIKLLLENGDIFHVSPGKIKLLH